MHAIYKISSLLYPERRANISKAMTGKKRGKYKTNENKILLETSERENFSTQSS